jgi:hypothetical protein
MIFNNDQIAMLRYCLWDEKIESRQPTEKTHKRRKNNSSSAFICVHLRLKNVRNNLYDTDFSAPICGLNLNIFAEKLISCECEGVIRI